MAVQIYRDPTDYRKRRKAYVVRNDVGGICQNPECQTELDQDEKYHFYCWICRGIPKPSAGQSK